MLREKSLAVELVEMQPWDHPDDLLRLNPAIEVPVLVDGPGVVSDSQAITDHLEEAYPEVGLLGHDQAQRDETRLVAWFDKLNREVTELLWREKLVKLGEEGLPALGDAARGSAEHPFHLAYIDYLYQARKWLAGDQLTLADLAAAAHLGARLHGRRALGRGTRGAGLVRQDEVAALDAAGLMDRLTGLKPPAHYDDPDFLSPGPAGQARTRAAPPATRITAVANRIGPRRPRPARARHHAALHQRW